MRSAYRKADILNMPKQAEVVKALKEFADAKLSHVFTLTEEEITNVFTALAYFLSEYKWQHDSPCVHRAKPSVFENTLLTMTQFERYSSGMRIEMWAM